MLMKAIEVKERGGAFELVEKEVPEPGAGQVRIKVQACGVCHGDAVLREGHWPNIQYPKTPGHEVVGVVDKLGANVTTWQPGHRVGVGWYGGGDHLLQVSPLTEGMRNTWWHLPKRWPRFRKNSIRWRQHRFCVRATPLLCAGNTTFDALRHSGAKAGDVVAIQGIGGLGHLAVQFASKLGYKTVALSRGKDKEQQAYDLGAHVYIDTAATNAGAELQKLGGARVILATAPNSKAIAELIHGLGQEGKLLVVAGEGEPMPIAPNQLLFGRKAVQGWTAGDAKDSEDTLNFSVLTGARPQIEVFPLEQAAEAYERMMASKVRFRAVLKIGD